MKTIARHTAIAALITLAACGGSSGLATPVTTTTQVESPEPTRGVPSSLPPVSSEPPSSQSSSSSSTPALASTSCDSSDLPPANPNAVVIVTNIEVDDPDLGLNIRTGPSTAESIQFSLPNGTTVTTTGLCERNASGTVWWEVQDNQWSGWASSRFLQPFDTSTPTACGVANFDPAGKGTVERILADVDGNGSTDTIFLTYDGTVAPPDAWTGSRAAIQIQYADGGLSYELVIDAILADGGPSTGLSQMPNFPQRIDMEGSSRSVGVISSHFDGSATGAGLAHIVGELNCSPTLIANLDVNPAPGNPMAPILCDTGGRSELFALDGLDVNGDYLATEYLFQGSGFVPQQQQTFSSQGLTQSPESAVC